MIKFADFFLTAINLLVETPHCDSDDNDRYLVDHQKTEDRPVEVNWLDLPDHILYHIADKVILQKDLIRFGAVCHPWQSVYADITRLRSRRIPLLMLATEDYKDDQTRSFYNLRHQIVFDAQVPIPHNMHCLGSSHGWLVTACPQTFQVRLFNPFLSSNNNEIHLPPLTTFQHFTETAQSPGFLIKTVLSTNPSTDPNYVIMAIYSCSSRLAFYEPGDSTWTSLYDEQFFSILDVIYYRDQFYVVTKYGQVFSFDFNNQEGLVVSEVAPHPPENIVCDKRYLVESSGDLLHVIRYRYEDKQKRIKILNFEMHTQNFEIPIPYYGTNRFDVFKLDPIEQTWVKLDNLGERILFLGDSSSLSISASDFPECKPNSIYFTDDFFSGFDKTAEECDIGGHDMGVYNLKNHTIESHYPIDADVEVIFPRPVWIEPPLLGLYGNSGVGISKKYMEASIIDYQHI